MTMMIPGFHLLTAACYQRWDDEARRKEKVYVDVLSELRTNIINFAATLFVVPDTFGLSTYVSF